MYTVIVVVILTTFGAIYLSRSWDGASRRFSICSAAVISLILGSAAAVVIGFQAPKHEFSSETKTIAGLHAVENNSGNFPWSGPTTKYAFHVKNEDGSTTPMDITASDRVRFYEEKDLTEAYWKTIYSKSDPDWQFADWTISIPRVVSEEFHVPEGTIVNTK